MAKFMGSLTTIATDVHSSRAEQDPLAAVDESMRMAEQLLKMPLPKPTGEPYPCLQPHYMLPTIVKEAGFLPGVIHLANEFLQFGWRVSSVGYASKATASEAAATLQKLLSYPVLNDTLDAASVCLPESARKYLPRSDDEQDLMRGVLQIAEKAKLLFMLIGKLNVASSPLSAAEMDRALYEVDVANERARTELGHILDGAMPHEIGFDEISMNHNISDPQPSVIGTISSLQPLFDKLLRDCNNSEGPFKGKEPHSMDKSEFSARLSAIEMLPRRKRAELELMYTSLEMTGRLSVLKSTVDHLERYLGRSRRNAAWRWLNVYHPTKPTVPFDASIPLTYPLFTSNMVRLSTYLFKVRITILKLRSDTTGTAVSHVQNLLMLPSLDPPSCAREIARNLNYAPWPYALPETQLERNIFAQLLKLMRKAAFLAKLVMAENVQFAPLISKEDFVNYMRESRKNIDSYASKIIRLQNPNYPGAYREQQASVARRRADKLKTTFSTNVVTLEMLQQSLLKSIEQVGCKFDNAIYQKLGSGITFKGQSSNEPEPITSDEHESKVLSIMLYMHTEMLDLSSEITYWETLQADQPR